MLKKTMAALAILVMLATVLSGCGGTDTDTAKETEPKVSAEANNEPGEDAKTETDEKDGGPEKDTVTMIINADVATLDPHNPTQLLARIVVMNMYETLLDYNKGEFTPVLCEDYKISEDGLKYTFNLKKGVKFHNGEEMKASDVVFSVKRAQSMPYMKTNTSEIKDVVATDDYTVEITLTQQYVPFLLSAASQINIVSEKAAEEYGEELSNNPVGTGAYKFVQWDAGQQIIMDRFEDWHGEAEGEDAPIKTAIFKVIGDASSSVIALETGEVDLTYNVSTISIQNLKEIFEISLEEVPTLGCGYLPMNLEKEPFSDVNFRLAMNYAIDKQKVLDIALEGVGILSDGIWSEDTVGYTDTVKNYEYNPEKAKEYLAKTNYDGRELSYKIGNEYSKKQAELIQEDLRSVGINVKIDLMEQNAWIQDMINGNYEISSITMTIAADADLWTKAFHSSAIDTGLNFSRLNSAEVDAAFDAGKSIMDPQEREKNYEIIAKYLHDNAIIVPLYFKVATPAFSKDLQIDKFYATGYAKVQDMSWIN